MASPLSLYLNTMKFLADGTVDWDADNIRLALIKGGTGNYIYNYNHVYFSTGDRTISSITPGSPTIVTSVGHGFVTGEIVKISGISAGDTIAAVLNGNVFTITVTGLDTFTLTPNTTDLLWSSGGIAQTLNDPAVSEVDDGSGYTLANHGLLLTGRAVTAAGLVTKFDANDATFASLSKTFRYGIIYLNTGDLTTSPLLGSILYDNTPADVSIPGVDFATIFNADGIFKISASA